MKKDLPPTPKTESAMSEEKIEVLNNISSRRKFITTAAVAGRVKEIQMKITGSLMKTLIGVACGLLVCVGNAQAKTTVKIGRASCRERV